MKEALVKTEVSFVADEQTTELTARNFSAAET